MHNNIFISLSRYADRQEENFLTESFVYLLNMVLERDHDLAINILQKLFGAEHASWFAPSSSISIATQLTIDTGRPDIVITVDNDKVAFVEIKHDSSLGVLQLERYLSNLINSHFSNRHLILLTRSRYSIQETTLAREQFYHVCWYEISGWLSEVVTQDQILLYLISQFLDFLKEKEMSMEKVDWEYMKGVPAMVHLGNMLGTAISEALPDEKARRTAGWNWMGSYIGENNDIWMGFRYQDPLKIRFENKGGTNPDFWKELDLPKVHFFSLSAGEQLECLIKFIQTAHAEYKALSK